MNSNEVQDFLAQGGRIMVLPTKKAKGVVPLCQQFGGNRLFMANAVVASATEAGMLKMKGGSSKRHGA